MTRLSLMNGERAPGGSGRSATAPATAHAPGRSRWDIAWLGGRSSAPWVVLAAALVLLVAVAGTAYTYLRPGGLGWGTRLYSIPSGREATLTFDVTKQPGRSAICDVAAVNSGGGVVGRQDGIVIPALPGGPRTTAHTVRVLTTSPAVIVQVDTCRLTSR